MNYDRTQRIRRAAILVASLEETLAEQMLESLPRLEATRILDEVDRLGDLDTEEIQDVLDEFRSAGRRGRAAEAAVEFTYSAPQPAATTATEASAENAATASVQTQNEADAILMAELLSHEHPQTITAALSRLSHDQGAAVFAALPAALQTEVLDRLANLDSADEDAVTELESQLQYRVEQHRQRHERAAAAAEMARRILVKTAPAQRDSLLARLSSREAARGRLDRPAPEIHDDRSLPQQAHNLATAVRMARQATASQAYDPANRFEAWTGESADKAAKAQAAVEAVREDRSRELESLSDRALLEALRVAGERTVQCALAASSESFLKRVAGMLPRRQAARLRQVVREIGPTRVAELREAQHELLRIAHDYEAAGVRTR